MREVAAEVEEALADVDGLIDLHVELQEEIPHIAVKVDLAAAEQYGIKPGDVRRAAATLIAGLEVSDIYLPAELYDVTVWGVPSTRYSLTSLRELLHRHAGRRPCPPRGRRRRADHADPERDQARGRVAPYRRRAATSRDAISARWWPTSRNACRRCSSRSEYNAEVVGEYAEREAAQSRLFWHAVLAAIAIFFLLQSCFGSWRLAAMAYLALPSALVGGVLATLLADRVISLGSLVGFLTVLGIASRNAILLINHYQHLEREEGEVFGPGPHPARGARSGCGRS